MGIKTMQNKNSITIYVSGEMNNIPEPDMAVFRTRMNKVVDGLQKNTDGEVDWILGDNPNISNNNHVSSQKRNNQDDNEENIILAIHNFRSFCNTAKLCAEKAISSIFGGYILGVIAYYQRHITGGVIVHMGVAGIMELLAYWASS